MQCMRMFMTAHFGHLSLDPGHKRGSGIENSVMQCPLLSCRGHTVCLFEINFKVRAAKFRGTLWDFCELTKGLSRHTVSSILGPWVIRDIENLEHFFRFYASFPEYVPWHPQLVVRRCRCCARRLSILNVVEAAAVEVLLFMAQA